VLFDSEDEDTDRWQPLWGSPGNVAARATVAIKESEPYYYDVAWSADGSIEAIVHVDLPFAMGVQWHPEAELGVDLFEELAAAARKRRSPTSGAPDWIDVA
jgi:Peptidase C26